MADCSKANRFRKIDPDLLFDDLGFSIFGQNPCDTYGILVSYFLLTGRLVSQFFY